MDAATRAKLDDTIHQIPLWAGKMQKGQLTQKEEEYKNAAQERLRKITIGAKDTSGYLVTRVLSRSDEYVIYEVQTNIASESIRTAIDSFIEDDNLLSNRYSRIRIRLSEIRGVLFKVKDESTYRSRIANIISHALSTGEISAAHDVLDKLKDEMGQVYIERIRNSLKYLFTIVSSPENRTV